MNNQNSKLIIPIILIILILSLYFGYNLFINKGLQTANPDNILKNTILGAKLDLISKENISFNNDVLNFFPYTLIDFSKKIKPSDGYGRENPFLP